MRGGRIGWITLVAMSLAIGCSHQTPEQKAQAKLAKQQAAETRALRKQADADAKAEAKRAQEQAKADKKAAQEQAKAEKKQTPRSVRLTAMKDTDYYPDDQLKVVGYPDIKPENYPRWLDKHAQAMAAAGASHEAMLYGTDFQGNELTRMGRSKLRLMIQDPPPTIYISAPAGDAQKQARMDAVKKFWQEGSAKAQIQVTDGVNPDVNHPANAGINALQQMDKQGSRREGSSSSNSSMGTSTVDRNTPLTGD